MKDSFGERVIPSIIMQEINPKIYLSKIENEEEKIKAEDQYWEQIRFVEKLGFFIWDASPDGTNVLWQPLEQKLYLIDFEEWGFRG